MSNPKPIPNPDPDPIPNPEAHYAYGPGVTRLETVMRLAAVKRWHMIDTTRTQNLAEHSANVALLAYVIAVSAPEMYFGSALNIAGMALLHDVPEVFIGDIPTHSKQWLNKEALDRAEESITPFEFRCFPADLRTKRLIKICDLADAIRFIRIHGADITSKHAQAGIEKQFWAKFLEVRLEWPIDIVHHVFFDTFFYAYETRIDSPAGIVPANVGAMVADMARRSRNHPWGPGRKLCDDGSGARDRMVGTEGIGPRIGIDDVQN